MKKSEYIKHLKQLIKKYHPDLCNNKYLESMYNEITKILVNKLNEIKKNNNFEFNKNTDNIYLYYKLGIKYFKNIHPNKFYKRNEDLTFETKTYKEILSVINKIYLSFNISEYYFNKIITEYPNSPYYQDSKDKIKLLKKLYKIYENISIEENKIINNSEYMNEMGLKIL